MFSLFSTSTLLPLPLSFPVSPHLSKLFCFLCKLQIFKKREITKISPFLYVQSTCTPETSQLSPRQKSTESSVSKLNKVNCQKMMLNKKRLKLLYIDKRNSDSKKKQRLIFVQYTDSSRI